MPKLGIYKKWERGIELRDWPEIIDLRAAWLVEGTMAIPMAITGSLNGRFVIDRDEARPWPRTIATLSSHNDRAAIDLWERIGKSHDFGNASYLIGLRARAADLLVINLGNRTPENIGDE
jgi:hypothetical protein